MTKSISVRKKIIKPKIQKKTSLHKNLKLYEPSVFWKKALKMIEKKYLERGIKDFRSDSTNLRFFVPTYGLPGNSFKRGFVRKIKAICSSKYGRRQLLEVEARFNGYKEAYSDFRVFKIALSLNDPIELSKFSESKVGSPAEHFCFNNKWYSRSSLNYLLGLCFLFSLFPKFKPKTILEIGGGFGTLAEILGKSNIDNLHYLNLDLYPMESIAKDYLRSCFKKDKKRLVTKKTPSGQFSIKELETFSFFPNYKIEDLRGSIDLFVNFISFQEMEPDIVANYIKNVQRLKPKLVLLRNLREGKQIMKGNGLGVKKPILRDDYISMFSDYVLVQSNVTEYGFRTVDGYNSELLLLKRRKEK